MTEGKFSRPRLRHWIIAALMLLVLMQAGPTAMALFATLLP